MTTDDTQSALRDLAAGLGRLEGKVDGMTIEQSRLRGVCESIDQRVGELERRDAKLIGIAAGVSAVVSLIAGWAKNLIGSGQ